MTSARDYNKNEIDAGRLLPEHVAYLVEQGALDVQRRAGLTLDGKAGPLTRAAIDRELRPDPGALQAPIGVSMYLRAITEKIYGTPEQAAERASKHGIKAAVILGAWQQPKGNKIGLGSPNKKDDRFKRYAEAFLSRGIDVWVWGYPWGGAEDAFVSAMIEVTRDIPITGWLLDPELGYKWSGGLVDFDPPPGRVAFGMRGAMEAIPNVAPLGEHDERIEQAKKLMDLTIAHLRASGPGRGGLGITSYGRTKFHSRFPWSVFASHGDWPRYGSPQLYTATAAEVATGIADWKEKGFATLIPSAGSYEKKSPQMFHHHLSTLLDADPALRGFTVWSWQQTSQGEWEVLERWSKWLAGGLGGSPPEH